MSTTMNTTTTTTMNTAAMNTPTMNIPVPVANEYKITETLQKYYDKVFQDGKLVNIHIGMWGMSYNLEEGDIKLDNKLPDTIKLGKKMLIKTAVYNKFKNVEQKIRKYLYTNSFEFPLVSQAHFVPKTKYMEVYRRLNEYRTEYLAMVDEFLEKYEDYKKEALEFYQQHKDTVDIQNLESYYPSLAAVKKKFYLDIVSFEIALPAAFAELNLQDEIQREVTHNEEKQVASRRYQEEYKKQINTHMAKINDFVGEVTSTLRTKIVEHCTVALNKINKKEVVSEANIRTLLKHIQEFREMNFVDDKAVEAELSKVENLISGDKDFSKDKDAIAVLQRHLNGVVSEAKALTDVANVSGEYFRKLSI